jgi:hypothetical protein
MTAGDITLGVIDGEKAAAHLSELRALYSEVYVEPPYEWGDEHAALFAGRFEVQRRQEGFALVEARDGPELAGFAFGVTLRPSTPWWQNRTTALPAEITTERPGRTFALVELLVQTPWRRQHIARAMHDLLLENSSRVMTTAISASVSLCPALNACTCLQVGYKCALSCPGQ